MVTSSRLTFVALLLIPTASIAAQSAGERPAGTCWRPGPLSRCRQYLVTELAYEYPMITTTAGTRNPIDDFQGRLVLSGGPMFNSAEHNAFGVLASVATDQADGLMPGRVELRYRRWVDAKTGLDFGAGLARRRSYDEFGNNQAVARGFTGSVAAETRLVGLMARVDLMNGHGRDQRAGFVGARVGGPAAPVATALVVVGFFVLLLSMGPS